MNMISTGSFLTETSASNKQSELVKKLTAAWEKKNSKTARAGGASLMALSLAACGGEDDTPFSQADVDAAVAAVDITSDNQAAIDAAIAALPEDTTPFSQADLDAAVAAVDLTTDNADAVAAALTAADGTQYASVDAAIVSNDAGLATQKAEAEQSLADLQATYDALVASNNELQSAYDSLTQPKEELFTAVNGETVATTSGNDTYTAVVSATASKNTYQSNDKLADSSSDDADVLTINTDGDISATPTISGIETININVDALSAGADVTDLDVALDNIAAGASINVDSVKSGSIINSVTFTSDAGHTITTSDDFTTVTTALAADADGVINLNAVGDAVNNVTVSVSGAADTLTVDAAGYVSVTAASVTDLVNITSVNDTTVSATASAGVFINAGGDVTLTDVDSATIVNVTAGGDFSVATAKMAAALKPVIDASGTVSVFTDDATSITVGGKKTITVAEDAGSDLVLANVTVKGEATTIDVDSAAGVRTVIVNGDQDYTLQMSAAAIDAFTTGTADTITLTDNTTAGTSTLKLNTAAGSVDATKTVVDNIDLAIDNGGDTLTVASGQNVNISVDQTGTTTISSVAATASTNTVSVTFDDGVNSATNTAVDITGDLDFTNLATVNLDMSGDSLASLAAETHVVDDMDSSGDVNITMGSNKLSITGDIAIGATNTLTITGSGTVTGDGSESITAKAIDASGVSAKVTLNEIESEEVASVKTGSGDDVVETTASTTEADLTITTGAGDDTLTLAKVAVGGESLTVDMGDGDDTLVLADDAAITRTGSDLNTVTGVEYLSYGGAFTVDSSVINNETWSISESAAATDNLTVTVLASDTAIDLSGLTVTAANAAAVAKDTFVVDASSAGLDGVTSIKGALITKNTITANDLDATTIVGGNKADALNGGAKADTITGGEGADVITGNEGNDTIILTETTSAVDKVTLIAASNGVDTVIGFNSSKDVVNLEGSVTGNDSAGAATFAQVNTALTAGAVAYDPSGSMATTDHIVLIGTALSTNGDLDNASDGTELLKALSSTSAAATQITVDATHKGYIAAFQDGNTYIYQADAGTSGTTAVVAGEMDLVAILQGVGVGEISAADFAIVT